MYMYTLYARAWSSPQGDRASPPRATPVRPASTAPRPPPCLSPQHPHPPPAAPAPRQRARARRHSAGTSSGLSAERMRSGVTQGAQGRAREAGRAMWGVRARIRSMCPPSCMRQHRRVCTFGCVWGGSALENTISLTHSLSHTHSLSLSHSLTHTHCLSVEGWEGRGHIATFMHASMQT